LREPSRINRAFGYAYGLKGDDLRAFEEFRKATDEAGAYNNLGYLYYKMGRYPQAVDSFKKAIESRPVWYVKAAENREAVAGWMEGGENKR